MRRETDRAFLLRSVNYRESDRILTLFLENTGKISALAKGARKSWRRYGGALELFSLFEVSIVKNRGNLWRLEEASLLSAHSELARDLSRMSAASFVLELARELTPENEPQSSVFQLIDKAFRILEDASGERARQIALATELKMLGLAGVGVSLQNCNACGTVVPLGRPVRFHPARGGVVCTPCGGGPITLSSSSIAALIIMDKNSLLNLGDVELAHEALDQVELAMADFVEHHLGRSIVMKTY